MTEAAGRPLADVFRIVNEESGVTIEDPAARAIREGVVVGLANHTELISRSGQHVPIDDSAAPIRDLNGRIRGAVLVFHDVTTQRAAERALRESEEHFRMLADSTPALIWMSGPERDLRFFNRSWLEFTGRSSEEEAGDGWLSGVHPDDVARVTSTFSQAAAQLRPFDLEYRLRRHDGTWRWLMQRAIPLIDAHGQFEGYISSAIDITDRRSIESENRRLYIEAQDANRAKDEFLGTISHELRTPLTAILGWSRLLLKGVADEPTRQLGLEAILRSARNQNELIDDILDVARFITGKLRVEMEVVDLVAIAREVTDAIRPQTAAKKITLACDFPETPIPLRGDSKRLRQVIWNLVSNALKFTPKGGSIDISIHPEREAVRLEVRDNGRGIAPDFLPRIWDRFVQGDSTTTREHGGLGLGLSLARYLTELHGGSIEAASAGVDKGAVFTVTLPRERAAEQPVSSSDELSAAALHSRSVLVVDDDESTREVIAAALRRFGADVLTAGSASDAMDAIGAKRYDVVVTDIAMPEEDGISLGHRIRTLEGKSVPVVGLTALLSVPEDAPFHSVVKKPVDPDDLARAVEEAIKA
jgi:PAS domain S-box-containing protein